MSSTTPHVTVRQQSALDLLSLHRAHEEISEVLASGTPLHTLLNLYPFDFEDYASAVIHRISNNANFPLLSGNLTTARDRFEDGASLKNSPTHLQVEIDYLAWTRQAESHVSLNRALYSRLSLHYSRHSNSHVVVERAAKEASDFFCEMIYKALAFASFGAAQPDLFLSPAVKDVISHVLIYLCSPDVYSRWGVKKFY